MALMDFLSTVSTTLAIPPTSSTDEIISYAIKALLGCVGIIMLVVLFKKCRLLYASRDKKRKLSKLKDGIPSIHIDSPTPESKGSYQSLISVTSKSSIYQAYSKCDNKTLNTEYWMDVAQDYVDLTTINHQPSESSDEESSPITRCRPNKKLEVAHIPVYDELKKLLKTYPPIYETLNNTNTAKVESQKATKKKAECAVDEEGQFEIENLTSAKASPMVSELNEKINKSSKVDIIDNDYINYVKPPPTLKEIKAIRANNNPMFSELKQRIGNISSDAKTVNVKPWQTGKVDDNDCVNIVKLPPILEEIKIAASKNDDAVVSKFGNNADYPSSGDQEDCDDNECIGSDGDVSPDNSRSVADLPSPTPSSGERGSSDSSDQEDYDDKECIDSDNDVSPDNSRSVADLPSPTPLSGELGSSDSSDQEDYDDKECIDSDNDVSPDNSRSVADLPSPTPLSGELGSSDSSDQEDYDDKECIDSDNDVSPDNSRSVADLPSPTPLSGELGSSDSSDQEDYDDKECIDSDNDVSPDNSRSVADLPSPTPLSGELGSSDSSDQEDYDDKECIDSDNDVSPDNSRSVADLPSPTLSSGEHGSSDSSDQEDYVDKECIDSDNAVNRASTTNTVSSKSSKDVQSKSDRNNNNQPRAPPAASNEPPVLPPHSPQNEVSSNSSNVDGNGCVNNIAVNELVSSSPPTPDGCVNYGLSQALMSLVPLSTTLFPLSPQLTMPPIHQGRKKTPSVKQPSMQPANLLRTLGNDGNNKDNHIISRRKDAHGVVTDNKMQSTPHKKSAPLIVSSVVLNAPKKDMVNLQQQSQALLQSKGHVQHEHKLNSEQNINHPQMMLPSNNVRDSIYEKSRAVDNKKLNQPFSTISTTNTVYRNPSKDVQAKPDPNNNSQPRPPPAVSSLLFVTNFNKGNSRDTKANKRITVVKDHSPGTTRNDKLGKPLATTRENIIRHISSHQIQTNLRPLFPAPSRTEVSRELQQPNHAQPATFPSKPTYSRDEQKVYRQQQHYRGRSLKKSSVIIDVNDDNGDINTTLPPVSSGDDDDDDVDEEEEETSDEGTLVFVGESSCSDYSARSNDTYFRAFGSSTKKNNPQNLTEGQNCSLQPRGRLLSCITGKPLTIEEKVGIMRNQMISGVGPGFSEPASRKGCTPKNYNGPTTAAFGAQQHRRHQDRLPQQHQISGNRNYRSDNHNDINIQNSSQQSPGFQHSLGEIHATAGGGSHHGLNLFLGNPRHISYNHIHRSSNSSSRIEELPAHLHHSRGYGAVMKSPGRYPNPNSLNKNTTNKIHSQRNDRSRDISLAMQMHREVSLNAAATFALASPVVNSRQIQSMPNNNQRMIPYSKNDDRSMNVNVTTTKGPSGFLATNSSTRTSAVTHCASVSDSSSFEEQDNQLSDFRTKLRARRQRGLSSNSITAITPTFFTEQQKLNSTAGRISKRSPFPSGLETATPEMVDHNNSQSPKLFNDQTSSHSGAVATSHSPQNCQSAFLATTQHTHNTPPHLSRDRLSRNHPALAKSTRSRYYESTMASLTSQPPTARAKQNADVGNNHQPNGGSVGTKMPMFPSLSPDRHPTNNSRPAATSQNKPTVFCQKDVGKISMRKNK